MYPLIDPEKERLLKGIQAAFAIPFIDDVEDFIWEVVFSYVKDIPLVDTLTNIRSKMLFDVVDRTTGIGWSAKALQKRVIPGSPFEVVIQRADIFKKSAALGFGPLTLNSPPQLLGDALWQHWYIAKVMNDAELQEVRDMRMCILVKSADRRTYAYFEENIALYNRDELVWRWTDPTRTGLQGQRTSDGFVVFRWYPNQKQLFERFVLPEDSYVFHLDPRRLPLPDVIDLLLEGLRDRR
jgi:hypothetical protein